MRFVCFFFFFQAEDGIRDRNVTGVQTCALPISATSRPSVALVRWPDGREVAATGVVEGVIEIGRASCRERVEISGVAGAVKKKKKESEDVREIEVGEWG